MKKLWLCTIALLLFSFHVFAQSTIEPPLITVTGQAEVRVPPDEVVFTLGVESVDKDMLAAKKRTDDSVREVLAIARRNNVKPEDVQTSFISIQPKYNTDDLEYTARQSVKREFVGYQVSKTVAVILRDISRFLAGQCDTYPALPVSYFDAETEQSLLRFEQRARVERRPGLSVELPDRTLRQDNAAGAAATAIFKNWLHYLSQGARRSLRR